MSTTCQRVAAALSDLPESGLGREEKVEVMRVVEHFFLQAIHKINQVYAARSIPEELKELQKVRQQELVEKDLEKYSYSPIG